MSNQEIQTERQPIVYAYLRVSTGKQDIESQKHGLLEYANENNLGRFGKIQIWEDTVSGKVPWQKRRLGELIELLQSGDYLLIPEFSRLSRKLREILELLELLAEKQINVHITKQRLIVDGGLNSKLYAFAFGIAAEIERELISQRTKEGQAKAISEGKKIGRPEGKAEVTRLDHDYKEIFSYLDKRLGVTPIAKLKSVSRTTLYEWFKRWDINPKDPKSFGEEKIKKIKKHLEGIKQAKTG